MDTAGVKLYKYIGFNKSYWSQPLIEERLYFSSISELRQTNDKDEFNYSWNSSSYFFSNSGKPLEDAYDRLFSSARILCLADCHSKKCWEIFCQDGGVCYEFSGGHFSKVDDITSGRIIYSDEKILNAPEYMIKHVKDLRIKDLISREKNQLQTRDLAEVTIWLEGEEPRTISLGHIVNELTFKKHKKFQDEREYRFIHPEKPQQSKVTPLVDLKLTFLELGLKLKRVYTTDINFVKKISSSENIRISGPSFL